MFGIKQSTFTDTRIEFKLIYPARFFFRKILLCCSFVFVCVLGDGGVGSLNDTSIMKGYLFPFF